MAELDNTTTRTYRRIDKTGWGEGPWSTEPDKVQWTDAATGLPCLVVRGGGGALCGYVGVAAGHPFFEVPYSHGPGDRLDVHGGITYSDRCQEGGDEGRAICHIPEPGQPAHVWWLGFDTAHLGDLTPEFDRLTTRLGDGGGYGETYRTVAYVREQCADLARQLAEIGRATNG